MEKSFATFRNQTLVFSTSSQSHIHNPITRRDFLGCGTLQLRRPSIVRYRYRYRDQKKKLKFGICTEIKCSMNESEGADSIIAIAVAAAATLGMLRIVYLSNGGKKKMNEVTSDDDEKADAVVSSKLCKHDADTSESQHNVERFLSTQDVSIQPTVNNNIYEDIKHDTISEVDVQKKAWTCEKISVTDVQAKDELAYSNEFRDLSLTTMMVNEVKSVGGELASKLPNLLSQMEVGPTVSSSSIFILDKEKESDDVGHIAAKPCEALISSNDVYLRESIKEVSSCNSERQNGVSSISRIKHLNTEPGQLDHKGKDTYSNRLKTVLKDSDTSAKRPTLTADSQSLTGCSKEVLVGKENGLLKTGIHRQIKFSRLPQQNGIAKDFSTPASYIRTYNSLLKVGRSNPCLKIMLDLTRWKPVNSSGQERINMASSSILSCCDGFTGFHPGKLRECVELLEEMEKKEMLDMEKVCHSKFLNTCKSQKAVSEAFRFCKLIRKPTLSTFNMLLSVCASSQDFEGAFQAMVLVKETGLVPDCKLYTTLISTCAKSGKVDAMFEIFHEAVNAGVEPNLNTYGALIDGCARAGQVAKAFGAYGIMRSKKVQPDRVIFNALITACGQSGAVDRAFDVLAEMRAETRPIDPDHVTIGALIKTCSQSGQVDRVREVYKMLQKYKIKGTPEVYTIAVNSCSRTGDLEFALSIYNDMKVNGVVPDEMFLSTIIDVAGHAGKVDTAFEILRDARSGGIKLGNVSYSSLMGACCNGKNWQKALELYEEIMAVKLIPTVSTLNALVTSLCDGDQLHKAVEVLDQIREVGVKPNVVTYSILIVACEKKGEAELGFTLFSKAKGDGILPNQIMCRCLTGLCLKSLEKAISLGDNIVTFNSGKPQINSKWTTLAIMAYRETISAGVIPTIEVFSQVLGCLQFPRDSSLKNTFIENLDIQIDISKCPNIYSLLDGFGEYDIRCFSVHEEAASLGVIPRVSFKDNPIVVDARKLPIHTVEVHLLTIIKGLKHRLAAGARLPNITVLLPVEKIQMDYASGEKRTINVAGRIGQSLCSMLRRVGLRYTGDASFGKIRISGLSLRRWFKPKLSESSASGKAGELVPVQTLLSKGIMDQQRNIRSIGLSLD